MQLLYFSRPLYVTVVYQGKYSHCMRIGVAVPLNSTVYRLRDAVSRETKIPMDQVLFLSLISSDCVTSPQCYRRTLFYHRTAVFNLFLPRSGPDAQLQHETRLNTLVVRAATAA